MMKLLKFFALVALAAVPLILIEKRRANRRLEGEDVRDNLEPEIEWE